MRPSTRHILSIDWWSKIVGLARCQLWSTVIFPVWYLDNDKMLYYYISDLITRYRVHTIVLWYPSKQKDIQEKINEFMKWLHYIIEHDRIKIELMDEDYTSVQAGEVTSNFRKNESEDTIAAMIILQRYLDTKKDLEQQ